jgi:hypothetical protein
MFSFLKPRKKKNVQRSQSNQIRQTSSYNVASSNSNNISTTDYLLQQNLIYSSYNDYEDRSCHHSNDYSSSSSSHESGSSLDSSSSCGGSDW